MEATVNTKRWNLVGLLALVVVLVAACGPSSDGGSGADFPKNADGYSDINVKQLDGLRKTTDVTLINVHIPYEGELPDTDLFIPFDDLSSHLAQLPEKDATIVLYCRSGSMSTSAARELAALGYTHVLELDGGFRAWESAGYELIDKR
jgi:rhodanese-related sulfurtransferase